MFNKFFLMFLFEKINTFSSEQIAKTGDLNADLIMRQNNLDKMAKFMQMKSNKLKVK